MGLYVKALEDNCKHKGGGWEAGAMGAGVGGVGGSGIP